MEQRFDFTKITPEGYKAMLVVNSYVEHSGLDLGLLELVKIRVSQMNGCAFCLAMHIPLARQHGITDDQINLVVAWREAPIYSSEMRAALAWAEAMTHLSQGEISDEVYDEVKKYFSEKQIADLAFAVVVINGWNRLMVCSRTPPQLAAGI